MIDPPAWARDAIFYQIFPDRFASSTRVPKPGPMEPWEVPPTTLGLKGGDLLGILEHLDELKDLGVTALYMTPVFASASNHRYHTDDYLAVDPILGGDAALRELLDEAHARDMRIVLDGVFNHSGRGFWPFHHVVEVGIQSPYRDWLYLDHEVLEGRRRLQPYPDPKAADEQRRLEAGGMGAGEASRRVLGYEAWWGLPALPKLNTNHPATREYLLGVAEHWLRFGIDGWRLDVAEEIDGGFWEEFRRRCRAVNPEAYLVAEIWHPKPEWLTGRHFDAFMNYPLAEAIMGFAGGASLDRRVIQEHHEYGHSIVSRDAASLAAEIDRLSGLVDPAVTAVQLNLLGSHDAPRLRTVLGGDLAAVRLAMLLQLTMPGAPCIYYGDELGMEGHHDPDCRRSYPHGPLTDEQATMRAFVRDLAAVRHGSRALRDGALRIVGIRGATLAMLRTHDEDAFVVVANAGDTAASMDLELPGLGGRATVLPIGAWARGEDRTAAWTDAGHLALRVPARSGLIVRLGP